MATGALSGPAPAPNTGCRELRTQPFHRVIATRPFKRSRRYAWQADAIKPSVGPVSQGLRPHDSRVSGTTIHPKNERNARYWPLANGLFHLFLACISGEPLCFSRRSAIRISQTHIF